MQNFMNYDFNIASVTHAMFVKPGKGVAVHKSRPFHGIALNLNENDVKQYVFENGKTVCIGQNEIIYLPKTSDYTVHCNASGNCYAINFDLCEEIHFQPFSFKIKNVPAFIREFEKATELWKNKRIAFQMGCKSVLYNILSMMQTEYNLKYTTQTTAALIAPAAEYIHAHYNEDCASITALAKMCGISEDYFRKLFKNIYGMSPRKYINERRLSYAREILKSGLYTVAESAEASGFTDMSHFSREFKKAFGVCPSEYTK